jgi:hypothetical protein
MNIPGDFRNGTQRITWIHVLVLLTAGSALLLARNTAPNFPNTSSIHAVSASTKHDQRPRFDNSSVQYCPPSATFVLSLPTEAKAHVSFATALLVSFHSKGAHYNRPPPRV